MVSPKTKLYHIEFLLHKTIHCLEGTAQIVINVSRDLAVYMAPAQSLTNAIAKKVTKVPIVTYVRRHCYIPLHLVSIKHDNFTAVCDGGCVRGQCRGINQCKCDRGWTGDACNECVPLAGCLNGNCTEGNDCTCFEGWMGPTCEIPICDPPCNTDNGRCVLPGHCKCNLGWAGNRCDDVYTLEMALADADCEVIFRKACSIFCMLISFRAMPISAVCNPECERANCIDNDLCLCHDGWTGDPM